MHLKPQPKVETKLEASAGDGLIRFNQWLFLVPLKGGRWHIYNPPIGPQLATYHLVGEPETTIDLILAPLFFNDFGFVASLL